VPGKKNKKTEYLIVDIHQPSDHHINIKSIGTFGSMVGSSLEISVLVEEHFLDPF